MYVSARVRATSVMCQQPTCAEELVAEGEADAVLPFSVPQVNTDEQLGSQDLKHAAHLVSGSSEFFILV